MHQVAKTENPNIFPDESTKDLFLVARPGNGSDQKKTTWWLPSFQSSKGLQALRVTIGRSPESHHCAQTLIGRPYLARQTIFLVKIFLSTGSFVASMLRAISQTTYKKVHIESISHN